MLDSFRHLDDLVFNGGRFRSMTTITILGIRVLQIWGDSDFGFTAGLLHALMLPDLRRLELLDSELRCPCLITTEDVNVIVVSLASSSFLEELRVDMVVIQGVDITQTLETDPNLTEVAIVEPHRHLGQFSITDKSLERMMDASFLPKLEDLEFVWAEDNVIEEDRVLNVIENSLGRLQSVIIGVRDGGELDKKALQRIRDLKELGLSVRLY
ncbi:hypothetical protein EDD85DRAFT_958009 [Armillaria nabsnona]|nr:hypothetical protein EDD85DRAFT_958009 [Armillaria nabsnona]